MNGLQIDNVGMLQLPQQLDLTNGSNADAFALLLRLLIFKISLPLSKMTGQCLALKQEDRQAFIGCSLLRVSLKHR